MSEEKLGQHYLAALNEAFPGVVLDHAWQTKDQLTVTVKVNYLPEVVEFLYYKQGGWLSVLFGNDERKTEWSLRRLLRAVDGEGHQVLGNGSRRS
ncbi:formate hydrogenlyase subunit E [Escherichia coli]|uniref:Formate hydrogenlyase subunit E n=1 Tax=Escherichia coli TaxID=562 RepID=A0A2X3K6V2_ECOLX|nr:formate hydrogenlyase subunit E [Escherichia coli]